MLAARITAPYQISIDDIDRPVVEDSTDAILMVTTSSISHWDVACYQNGVEGAIPGAELAGIVVEIGPNVKTVDIDDLAVRKVTPDITGAAVMGGHAEYVRVRNADSVLVRTTAAAEERTVLAGGAVSMGIAAAEKALAIEGADSLLAWGCDAGALAAMAWMKRKAPASLRRYAFDHIPGRSTLASTFGAERIDYKDAKQLRPSVVLLGSPPKGPTVEELQSIGISETTVISLTTEWPTIERVKRSTLAIQLREIDLTPVVSHVMPLDEAEETFARVANVIPGTQTVLLKP